MAAPFITSRAELLAYIKRRLGYPVVNIEVTDDQYQDQINDTIQKFFEVAHGGTQLRFSTLAVTAGLMEYQLPYEVAAVLTLFDGNSLGSSASSVDGIFSVNQYLATDMMKTGYFKSGMLTIELVNQFIATMETQLSIKPEFDFNTLTKKLYLLETPSVDINMGMFLYEQIDADGVGDDDELFSYDHRWIKQYATELCRLQWGQNLMKYEGSVLPNGLQLNVPGLIDAAEKKIEKLEGDLEAVYTLPTDWFIG